MNGASVPADARDLDEYLQWRRAEVDAALEGMLPSPPDCPPLIADAMRYSLFAGGKRLRPILTLAAADSVGHAAVADTGRLALPGACAIEMIHTYSLIHDDLPAMDDDTLRRGRPTAHVAYGEGIAILAGDGLLTEAFRVLTRLPETDNPAVIARKLRTAERVAAAAGVMGMVGGQVIDLHATGQVPDAVSNHTPVPLDGEGLRAMHARKTGALIRAAAVAGAIMAGGSDTQIEGVDLYATHLGLAFQIVDDLLDVEGSAAELGKTAGKDAAAGKPTYPSLYGLDESHRLAAASIAAAKATLTAAELGGHLGGIADWVLSRTH